VAERARQLLSDNEDQPSEQDIISDITSLLDQLAQPYGEDPPLQLQEFDQTAKTGTVPTPRYLRCGRFTIDQWSRSCYNLEQPVPMPPSIFDYMVVLARHFPEPVTYTDLVHEAQGYKVTPAEARKMCKWRVFQLRQLLEPDPSDPRYVITQRGVGLRLVCEE